MVVMGFHGFTTRVAKEISTFWWVLKMWFAFAISILFVINIVSGHGHAWAQSLGCLEFFGPVVRPSLSLSLCTSHNWNLLDHECWILFNIRKIKFLYISFLCFMPILTTSTWNRMSPSMVACIAVEAISILEKLHLKGYSLLPTNYYSFNFWRPLSIADVCI